MKTVTIEINAEGIVLQFGELLDKTTEAGVVESYDSWDALVEDGIIHEDWIELYFMKTIDKITYKVKDGEEIEITKKGKYIKKDDYILSRVELPHVVHLAHASRYYTFRYYIELQDDEEFDPMKLQLIKSDYEVNYLPYGIVVYQIVYNGGEVDVDENDICVGTWDEDDIYYYDNGVYGVPQF